MKPVCLLLFIIVSLPCRAQLSLYDSVNIRHNKLAGSAVAVLAGWSLANVASGLIGQNNSEGEAREFHRRNAVFGGINLALSGLAVLRLRSEAAKAYTPAQTFKRVTATQKLLLFNAGLDLAYVAYGLYVRERANRYTGRKHDRLRGTGNSLLLQGGFLTLFDFMQYALQAGNAKRLNGRLHTLAFTATQNGVGLVYRF